MFLLGSAYPTAKLGLNASIPPILFGAIRMAIVFIVLIPFFKIKLPNKKYLFPLLGFAFSMGAGVNLFLYLSVNVSTILSPIVIGAQLSIPLAIICEDSTQGENRTVRGIFKYLAISLEIDYYELFSEISYANYLNANFKSSLKEYDLNVDLDKLKYLMIKSNMI